MTTTSSFLDRRTFLGASAAVPLAFGLPLKVFAQAPTTAGLIERVRDPRNLEFPFHALDQFIVPNDRFFVRCHFPIPTLETRTWRLRVEGAVTRPLELSYDDLRNLPSRTVTATLECAGNSRALNVPPLRGVGWQQGAVSNAAWTGVSLAAVLERAGVRPGAVEVVLEGADRGEISAEPRPTGPIAFARSLPLAKARQEDVLLAYRMNGVDLPPDHGFPLRAIVPGWYGMASVKWLTRIIVAETPFQGFWQTTDYSYFERVNGLAVQRPITEMQVKSQIAMPRSGDMVASGANVRVHGAAWTGESEITRVEVSADGGQTWSAARLLPLPPNQTARYVWWPWEFTWRTPAAGRVTLMSRATDARGQVQPATRDANRRNYMVNHMLPIEVQVR